MALRIIAALVAAYLLGSIPTAYIIGRLRGKADIRQIGTRNMGAMNVFYQVGFVWGAVVLLTDIAKGAAAMVIADALNVPNMAYMGTGLVAVLGHAFPVFLGFRGGKGGAVSIGVLFHVMWPWSLPINTAAFLLLLAVTRAPTISYSLAFACYPLIAWLAFHRWDYAIYPAVLLVVPLLLYIPRIKEMRDKAGSWRRVFQRKSVGERY